jgi:hypothetical protein
MANSSKNLTVNDANTVVINGKPYKLQMVTMKYIKDGFYSNFILLNKFSLVRMGGFEDGPDIIKKFLLAVFQDEQIVDEIYDVLDAKIFKEILNKVKTMNELEDEEELKND